MEHRPPVPQVCLTVLHHSIPGVAINPLARPHPVKCILDHIGSGPGVQCGHGPRIHQAHIPERPVRKAPDPDSHIVENLSPRGGAIYAEFGHDIIIPPQHHGNDSVVDLQGIGSMQDRLGSKRQCQHAAKENFFHNNQITIVISPPSPPFFPAGRHGKDKG